MIDLETTDPATVEAALITSKGTMVITFFPAQAPGHVRNFLGLAQRGFYDGLAFHRVVRNFMVQAGCPNTRQGATGQPGTGRPEGPGLRAEFHDHKHVRGVVSMARGRDPNSAGSQFFVVHGEAQPHLDGAYTVFGQLEEGFEVLDDIAAVDCTYGPNGERSQPKERIEIERIELRPRQHREPIAGAVADAGAGAGS